MGQNTVVIACAGSGKTTFIVKEALAVKNERVLITTYTESNDIEIRAKFFELNGHVPSNVVIMTWFSLLIAHGVKPFQAPLVPFPVKGMQLVQSSSGVRGKTATGRPIYWGEQDHFRRHYFNSHDQIYSDKMAKLVLRCDKAAGGLVLERLQRVFPHIFVDEVQDLAGYDLDILAKLFAGSARVLLVGDPRQVTYLTHIERRHDKYAEGKIVDFLNAELPKKVKWHLDDKTLSHSHRNAQEICNLSSKLYPHFLASGACVCEGCRPLPVALGNLIVVKPQDVRAYLGAYTCMQLRDDKDTKGVQGDFNVMNFGVSKGRGFDHVLVFPTKPMLDWFKSHDTDLKPVSRARLYVALTRARYSVAVVTTAAPADFHGNFVQFTP